MKNKLALFGGNPIVYNHSSLRLNWPIVVSNDFQAIKKIFKEKDFSGRGSKEIYNLEKEFADFHGVSYVTALNSGTAALHTALVSLGIKAGDEVLVTSFSFIASAMAILHNQSIPIFVDIDPNNYNIAPSEIEKHITPRTKAIIVVHMHGIPVELDPIIALCKKYNLKLIEDVAQAPGARYHGKLVGTFGDAAAFSLMSQKNLATCGEAGMLINRTLEQKNRAEMTRIYGEIIKDKESRVYNSFTLGWNYTLNPLQATMARTQLKKFNNLTKSIQKKGKKFSKELKKFNWIETPTIPFNSESVYHFFRIRLKPEIIGYKNVGRFRQAIQDALNAEGLNVRHYQNTPLPCHPVFQNKKAFGRGLPWSLNKEKVIYKISDYPNTINVIENTLVIGAMGLSPSYLLRKGTIEKYIRGFNKINENMNLILKYADEIDYVPPWKNMPMQSDSYNAKYELLS